MWPDLRKRTTYPSSLDFANIMCGGFVLGVTTNPGVLADRYQRILSLFSAKDQVFIPRSPSSTCIAHVRYPAAPTDTFTVSF